MPRSSAPTIPAVGTFHSARAGRNPWYQTLRSPLRPLLRRITSATAVSDQARAPGRAHVRYRMRDRPERRGGRSVREGRHAPAIAARDLLRRPARAAQGVSRAARRVRAVSTATPTSGSRATVRSATTLRGRDGAVGRVARPHLRRREGDPPPERDRRVLPGDRRRVVRHRAARGDGRRRAARRVRHRRLPRRRPARATRRCSSNPATRTRSRQRCARCSTTRRAATRSSRPGAARADEFSMERARRAVHRDLRARRSPTHAGLDRAS